MKNKRLITILTVALLLFSVVGSAFAADVSDQVTTVPANSVVTLELVTVANNLNACEVFGSSGGIQFKTPGGSPVGTHNVAPGVTVTVSGSESTGYTVEIVGGVLADVFLKSSEQNNNWYNFAPPVTYASPLFAPFGKAASHMTFCVDEEAPVSYDFTLSGKTFKDFLPNGPSSNDVVRPFWDIHITGTGFTGEAIDEIVSTDTGFWSFGKSYLLSSGDPVQAAQLTICEIQIAGWYQTYPLDDACYEVTIQPTAGASVGDLDFGNWGTGIDRR